MICPECGSYQPDRAKYCGICGSALSQEGLVESFLGDERDLEIAIPRHRSFWFYLTLAVVCIAVLAVLGGAGYLVYRVGWGEKKGETDGGKVEENTLDYADAELGFSLTYPKVWTLEEATPAEDQLAYLRIYLSEQKQLELYVYQLDPVVLIGGIEAIEEYLAEDAVRRVGAMGGEVEELGAPAPTEEEEGYAEEPDTGEPPAGEEGETEEAENAELLFTNTSVHGLPAFYLEFNANFMGEESELLLYYIVAGDLLFVFQGRAPIGEYADARPQFMAMIGSFRWEALEEPAEQGLPEISAGYRFRGNL